MPPRIQTLDGLPVYDAKEPIEIEVISADIHEKDRKDPGHCAVAEACKRELQVTEARAYLSRLYIKQGDHWLRYKLPEAVRMEVASFDRGGGFSQGTYHIPPLSPSHRQGARPSMASAHPGTGAKRRTHRQVEGLRAPSPLYGGASEQKAPRA